MEYFTEFREDDFKLFREVLYNLPRSVIKDYDKYFDEDVKKSRKLNSDIHLRLRDFRERFNSFLNKLNLDIVNDKNNFLFTYQNEIVYKKITIPIKNFDSDYAVIVLSFNQYSLALYLGYYISLKDEEKKLFDEKIDNKLNFDVKDFKKVSSTTFKYMGDIEKIDIDNVKELIELIKKDYIKMVYEFGEVSNEFLRKQIINSIKIEENLKSSFYNSLKTKGFVILAGLSGSGKTKIFEEFTNIFGKEYSCFISVKPDFKDTKSLLGFFNPLEKKYQSTYLLKFILKATKDLNNPYFILFDEMNLARVEYYFADFLSVLESSRDDKGFTKESIKLHNENGLRIPKEMFLPPNLYIVGSVNIDETTHIFSPKVLDRAFTIEFDVGDFSEYLKFLENMEDENSFSDEFIEILKSDFTNQNKFAIIDKNDKFKEIAKDYAEKLQEINTILKPYNLHFGYRVFDEIIAFLVNSEKSIFEMEKDLAFDLAIKMKVLPKFHGTKRKLEKPLKDLLEYCEKSEFENTKEKIEKMQRDLSDIGFCSFL